MTDKKKTFSIFASLAKVFSKKSSPEEVLKKIIPSGQNLEKRIFVLELLAILDVRASEIMTARAEIIALDVNSPLEKVVKTLSNNYQARYLVYRKTLDYTLGYVDAIDLYSNIIKKNINPEIFNLRKYIKKYYTTSSNIKIIDLLMEMRDLNRSIAITIDEFGGLDGLVSIEDVVIELSSITRTIDSDLLNGENIELSEDGSFLVEARTKIKNLEPQLNMKLRAKRFTEDPPDTIGGLISALCERVPQIGEIIPDELIGLEYKIIDADPRRIKLVRIFKKAAKD